MSYNDLMQQSDWTEYIDSNPDVLLGKPIVKGTRISVDFILGLFSQGWSVEQVLSNYPNLSKQSIQAVFSYASDALQTENFFYFKTGTDK